MGLFSDPDAFPAIRAQFAAEISAAIDVIAETESIDTERIGYVSYSMGVTLLNQAINTYICHRRSLASVAGFHLRSPSVFYGALSRIPW